MIATKSQFTMPEAQKRKDRRFKQWNKTRVWTMEGARIAEGSQAAEAFTYDLSIGGARLHAMEAFEVGAQLRLQVELVRTGETLRVEGLVKWCRRDETANVFEMGVEFQHTCMATVLALMKSLHDGRRPDPAKGAEAGLGRS